MKPPLGQKFFIFLNFSRKKKDQIAGDASQGVGVSRMGKSWIRHWRKLLHLRMRDIHINEGLVADK